MHGAPKPPESAGIPWWLPVLMAVAPILMVAQEDATLDPVRTWKLVGLVAACTLVTEFALMGMFGARRGRLTLTVLVTTLVVAPFVHPAVALPAAAVWAGVLYLSRGRLPRALELFLTASTLFLVAWPAVGQTRQLVAELRARQLAPETGATAETLGTPRELENAPDVWWIVLDGYGRADVLNSLYGVDDGLEQRLRARGFHVASRARANYAQTLLSMSSALNLEPLDALIDVDPESRSRAPLRRLIRNNRLVTTLKEVGYTTVAYASEYQPLGIAADVHRGPLAQVNGLEHVLLRRSLLMPLGALFGEADGLNHWIRRNHLRWTFSELGGWFHSEAPQFTFAHILAPHPPFVFQADGTPRRVPVRYVLSDGSHWYDVHKGTGESYEEGYAEMVRWTSEQIERVIDRIEANGRPAVIVIHSDHGAGSRLHWSRFDQSDVVERMAILNAVRMPDGDHSGLHDALTPIDTGRYVVSRLLGLDLPLRREPSLFSLWKTPFDFVDVVDTLDAPPEGSP